MPGSRATACACATTISASWKISPRASAITQARGGKFYLVSNILPHNAKLKTYLDDMAPVIALKPDALIMADPGLMMMIRERWPEMPIHLSVQANTVNHAAVKFWRSTGVSRVILSRELSLDEVAEIRQECPDTELEVFVHGALCIAYSGRCLLSGYFNHRDPNQGSCTNSCRWDYKVHEGSEDAAGDVGLAHPRPRRRCASADFCRRRETEHPAPPRRHLAAGRERAPRRIHADRGRRTRQLHPQFERPARHRIRRPAHRTRHRLAEDRGPHQVALLRRPHLPELRQAIDDAVAGRPFDAQLIGQLDGLANRGYTAGFYDRHPDRDYQNYLSGSSESSRSLYVGDVLGYDAEGRAEINVKNRFSVGDRIEIIRPAGNFDVVIDAMHDKDGKPVSVAPGSGHRMRIALPPGCEGAFVARYV